MTEANHEKFRAAEAILKAAGSDLKHYMPGSLIKIADAADKVLQGERERTELRFHGDLDKWMKELGAGITGYQPEAFAAMDAAVSELVACRQKLDRIKGLVCGERDPHWSDALATTYSRAKIADIIDAPSRSTDIRDTRERDA
jgi:hypothetical protein